MPRVTVSSRPSRMLPLYQPQARRAYKRSAIPRDNLVIGFEDVDLEAQNPPAVSPLSCFGRCNG
jgi:hypothetical protein